MQKYEYFTVNGIAIDLSRLDNQFGNARRRFRVVFGPLAYRAFVNGCQKYFNISKYAQNTVALTKQFCGYPIMESKLLPTEFMVIVDEFDNPYKFYVYDQSRPVV